MFPGFAFRLQHGADFLACVTAVPFVDDVKKRGKIILLLGRTVHAVADRDKPHALFGKENVRIKTYPQIVPMARVNNSSNVHREAIAFVRRTVYNNTDRF